MSSTTVTVTQRSFPARPDAIAKARAFVRGALSRYEGGLQDDVTLMVSELCTNAILHGGGPFVVMVEADDRAVTVTVTDHGDGDARMQPRDVLRPRGRGLRIVDELADKWGTERTAGGETVVWFRRELQTAGC